MDSLINRGHVDGYTNLAIGEATVVRDAFTCARNKSLDWISEDLGYPMCNGMPELRKAVMAWAISSGICNEDHPGHVVITNGATQALLASISDRYDNISLQAPYWPRMPVLIKSLNQPFDGPNPRQVLITTWPNNPSGNDLSIYTSPGDGINVIWDAVYASDIYGFEPNKIPGLKNANVIIGSMSKVFGLSGLRIGWAIFKNEVDAELATKYVETTTSGVSAASQLMALEFLTHASKFEGIHKKVKQGIRDTIQRNATDLKSVLEPNGECHGAMSDAGGMFGWFLAHDSVKIRDAFNAAKIFVVRGDTCGVTNQWFRLNCAASRAEVQEAVEKLRKVL